MSVTIVRGDLLEADAQYICHQVNCQGAMGAGIAKQIADKWPYVKKEYTRYCDAALNRHDLLGRIQMVAANGGHQNSTDPIIVNIFGQEYYGRSGVYTDTSALIRAFRKLNDVLRQKGRRMTVAFPHGFGCGLAGGDWSEVEELIVKYLPDCDVVIYMK